MADEPVTTAPAAEPTPAAPVANLIAGVAAANPAPAVDPGNPAAPVDPAPAVPVVPEKYEYKPPEGIEVSEEGLSSFNAKAKELGLTQDQYKAAVDFALARDAENAKADGATWDALQTQWQGETFNDPAIGDGKKLLPEVSQAISRVNQEFGSPELIRALEITGAGNNPEVVRFFHKIGKALGDAGSLQFGKPAPATPKGNSFEEVAGRLYPNMNQ